MELEKSEINSSQTGNTMEIQQRLDAFVENLEQQMDIFVAETSENRQTNSSNSERKDHAIPDISPALLPTGQRSIVDKEPASAPIKQVSAIPVPSR